MTPFECQLPLGTVLIDASHSTCGGSPDTPIFFRKSFVKNARKRLSGDQNGAKAPAVPGSSRAVSASSGRTQMRDSSPGRPARNAIVRPSGETAGCEADGFNTVPGGAAISNRVRGADGGGSRARTTPITPAMIRSAATPKMTAGVGPARRESVAASTRTGTWLLTP